MYYLVIFFCKEKENRRKKGYPPIFYYLFVVYAVMSIILSFLVLHFYNVEFNEKEELFMEINSQMDFMDNYLAHLIFLPILLKQEKTLFACSRLYTNTLIYLNLEKKINHARIYIGIKSQENVAGIYSIKNDTLTIPYEEIEAFLNATLKKLETTGFSTIAPTDKIAELG
jgi:hypothetical protein